MFEVTGFKPGCAPAQKAETKLQQGERLSICGKFAINTAGQWRELSPEDCVNKVPDMGGITPEGKPIPDKLAA